MDYAELYFTVLYCSIFYRAVLLYYTNVNVMMGSVASSVLYWICCLYRFVQATEKELEALALYMGHSLSMQRSSYDRRTLDQKVAPAVNLLETISKKSSDKRKM